MLVKTRKEHAGMTRERVARTGDLMDLGFAGLSYSRAGPRAFFASRLCGEYCRSIVDNDLRFKGPMYFQLPQHDTQVSFSFKMAQILNVRLLA